MNRLKEVRPWTAFFLGWIVAALIVFGFAAAAAGDPPGSPPGQGECQHGNSGQECRPDPQPDHGQDCEEHGPNEGGVNEDHCLGPTPSPTPTPDPTPDPTPTPCVGQSCDPTPTPTPTADPPPVSPEPEPSDVGTPKRLARTGITATLAWVGGGLVVAGFLLLMLPLLTMDAARTRTKRDHWK